jgi:hypothetical protein
MKITDDMELSSLDDSTVRCKYRNEDGLLVQIDFMHSDDVNVGDYITYMNDDDVYHYTEKSFEERNIID